MPDIELIPIEFVYKASTSNFGTLDFRKLMLEKVQRVKEYIKAHIGEVVLISDIDIVVYDNFQHHLEMNDSTDIVFQKIDANGGFCTGFILLRCSDKTHRLWTDIEIGMSQFDENSFINEENILNKIIGNYNLNVKLFDDSMWSFSISPKPEKIYIHHVNCTVPNGLKSSFQLKCEQMVHFLEHSSLPIRDELLSMIP
jgi:hypothetical protein